MTARGAAATVGTAMAGVVMAGVVMAGVAMLAAACGGSPPPPPPGERLAAAIVATMEASESVRAPWRCAATDGPRLLDETLVAGARTWKLAGGAMRLEGKGPTTIGVIADAGGAAPSTLAGLGALKPQLAGADVVVALGGMGSTQAELEATLGALADRAAWPVVALPGDLEPAGALAGAIAKLRARGAAVIDGRLAQRIELPGATIATVPGAGAEARLVAGPEGCAYRAEDVGAAFADLTQREGLRILASAEAPRIAVAGEASGELALAGSATQPIDLALYGPTAEAPTPERAGGRDGAAVPLTPGSCDATTRLPGGRNRPSAGLLTIHGTSWRWKPIFGLGD